MAGLLAMRMQAFTQYRQGIVIQTERNDVYAIVRYIRLMNAALPADKRVTLDQVPAERVYEKAELLWQWVDKHAVAVEEAISGYLDDTFQGLQD